MDPCAHRCDVVQRLVLRAARGEGVPEDVVRLSLGLAVPYVPVTAHPAPCNTCPPAPATTPA